MYTCIVCGKRIDTPSKVAKCFDCALAPRMKQDAEEDRKRAEAIRRQERMVTESIRKELEYKVITLDTYSRSFPSKPPVRYLQEASIGRWSRSGKTDAATYAHLDGLGSFELPREADYYAASAKKADLRPIGFVTKYRIRELDDGSFSVTLGITFGIAVERVRAMAAELARGDKPRMMEEERRHEEERRRKRIQRETTARLVAEQAVRLKQNHRSDNCWRCRKYITTRTHLICYRCKWIQCECGACGCNYGGY
ncbi:hypothetical protein [Paenibacillus flagellatus]|uniref:Uncharacterized protein n=1 Tax=Paenibacillus flagellatus TaxID=2211139 RepID=A0A2V5K7X4_9BACL|nr:hypothetical protein [Paenibacillus flagellatus]PYI54932.1 hypothetical protein DLM86_10305 [Paenibacillus flagellatus]